MLSVRTAIPSVSTAASSLETVPRHSFLPVLLSAASVTSACDEPGPVLFGLFHPEEPEPYVPTEPDPLPTDMGGADGTGGARLVDPLNLASDLRGTPFDCDSEALPGPGEFLWCKVQGPAATVTENISENLAQALVATPPQVRSGLAFRFDDEGTVYELDRVRSMILTGNIPTGQRIEVVLGQKDAVNCVYSVDGRGLSTYEVDLSSPQWCEPSPCGVSLLATGGIVSLPYWTGGAENFAVTDISFAYERQATKTQAELSGLGPMNRCWFLFGRESSLVEWTSPLSVEQASVSARSPVETAAGMGMEFPPGTAPTSRFSSLEMDAVVTQNQEFDVVLGYSGAYSCIYRGLGLGAPLQTYSFDLTNPTSCYGSGESEIVHFQLLSLFDPVSELTATVTGVRLVP